ncbi:MAG: YcgN family cysteine cluster protein [Oligoflexus sp.]
MTELPFWKTKTLDTLSPHEWESLCDGCGKCCMNKIEDEDTGEISFTNVACKLFDAKQCRCQNYNKRRKFVPECQILTPKKVRSLAWLPGTCAYRLLAEGKDLPEWHHLVSGSRTMIHKVGASMKHRVISEKYVKNLEDHVVDWLA